MSRLLFLIAVAVVVYWLLKSYRERLPEDKAVDGVEDMVRCAYCGVHLPKSEGILADGRHYCSEAHRRASVFPPPGA
ncbi:MAG: hypothetical protein GC139_04445 [Sideroxydans sp.]|nr:hypothetical protein [Sideroxydans sp.]